MTIASNLRQAAHESNDFNLKVSRAVRVQTVNGVRSTAPGQEMSRPQSPFREIGVTGYPRCPQEGTSFGYDVPRSRNGSARRTMSSRLSRASAAANTRSASAIAG